MDRKLSESCWSEEECMEKCGLVKVRNQLSGRKEFVFRVQAAL